MSPLQSKTQVGPAADVAMARKLLNVAGRGIDAAFRSLTLDALMVRGKATLGSLKAASTTLGATTVSGNLTVGGNETVTGNLTVSGSLFSHFRAFGFAGSLAGSAGTTANPWKVQFGTQVVVTNSAGGFAITFPGAFPSGLITVLVSMGDNSVANATVEPIQSQCTLTGLGGQAFTGSTGVGLNVVSIRINWIAIGW